MKVGFIFLIIFIMLVSFFHILVFSCGDDDDDTSTYDPDDTNDDDSDDDDDDSNDDDDEIPSDVWVDPATGLMWQKESREPGLNTEQSNEYCQNLELSGYNDWHMPTISELRSLVRDCKATETGGYCDVSDSCLEIDCWEEVCDEGCPLHGGPGLDGCFWPPELGGLCSHHHSSSFVTETGATWVVQFKYGSIAFSGASGAEYSVRCVREDE